MRKRFHSRREPCQSAMSVRYKVLESLSLPPHKCLPVTNPASITAFPRSTQYFPCNIHALALNFPLSVFNFPLSTLHFPTFPDCALHVLKDAVLLLAAHCRELLKPELHNLLLLGIVFQGLK